MMEIKAGEQKCPCDMILTIVPDDVSFFSPTVITRTEISLTEQSLKDRTESQAKPKYAKPKKEVVHDGRFGPGAGSVRDENERDDPPKPTKRRK